MIYISGPITNELATAQKRFGEVEKMLRLLGHKTFNPYTFGIKLKARLKREPTQEEYLYNELPYLLKSEMIYMLDGWEKSNGAKFEYFVAKECGIIVYGETK